MQTPKANRADLRAGEPGGRYQPRHVLRGLGFPFSEGERDRGGPFAGFQFHRLTVRVPSQLAGLGVGGGACGAGSWEGLSSGSLVACQLLVLSRVNKASTVPLIRMLTHPETAS